ncbi:iron complex transport system permease protein [Saccharopolyspora erythraea NRRL 2338]|uniref:ABC iron transporter, permease component n=2 Tax=Saccharopolyspora erythraea TaxID=1836 RepID=A4F7E2_SACEN|nr:iron ABC transporter permease [Saccharopolyspora erythraea]EQD84820.1 ABC transporter permease [Saccharopolyspora erythraea D]PFG93768.1 iron complex transport system permease protein [Saccharopolyspora erythraea NRRL 2338]QRK90605.1 iron ABC transporter permease [Saccharopolyspora erythraea]CAL99966.1 ABC iron transporter, permease component [Saccharopolyspora erythraea NRRL 2338]
MRGAAVHVVLLAALVLAGLVAVSLGSVHLPPGQVWRILAAPLLPVEQDWTQVRASIVWDSRLPRVVTAVVVGAALALAGGIAQIVTSNPMADPYLLGVSQGAGLAVSLVTVLGFGAGAVGMATLPVAAFAGGLLALLFVLAVAGRSGSVTTLVLGGLAVGEVAYALTSLVLHAFATGDQAKQVLFWITGGLGAARWELLPVPAAVLGAGIVAAVAAGRWMNLLHAGDDAAAAMGLHARRFRLLSLVAVSLLAGTAVAVAGGIVFVGLLVPHAAAFLVGAEARRMLSVSAVLGALFLVLADLAARLVVAPSELPVGVLTAIVGGPLFLVMLRRRRRTA